MSLIGIPPDVSGLQVLNRSPVAVSGFRYVQPSIGIVAYGVTAVPGAASTET